MLLPASKAIRTPKLLAPAPAVDSVPGNHPREMKAAPPALPIFEIEKRRLPSSRRARKVLDSAYPVRFQNPFFPDRRYRLSSWSIEEAPYCSVVLTKCSPNALVKRVP